MKIRIIENIILLFIIIAADLSCEPLFAQESSQKPSRQAAMEAFSKEDFAKAYNEFSILLQMFPRDPLYKYYSGVCLVKLNRDPESASTFLSDALNGSLDIKSIPDDAWFYLGRSQQMSGRYADAIKSFSVFENKAGNRSSRLYNVSDFVQECNEGSGRLKETDYKQPVIADKSTTQTKPAIPVAAKAAPQLQNLPAGYDKLLSEAMKYQVRADSLNALAAGYRKEFNSLPASQKPAAKIRITDADLLAASYQKRADDNFAKAGVQSEARKDPIPPRPEASKPAIAVQNTDTKPPETNKTIIKPAQPQEPVRRNNSGVYSMFKVETDPEAVKNQKVMIDPELPAGLVYRIQMGVFSKPLSSEFFKGITPALGFRIPDKTSIKYFVGVFRRMADASRSLLAVKQAGFRDSFITAVLDGKPVSIERAAILENEWGQKSLIKPGNEPNQPVAEEGPSTLIFRVEVARAVLPVSRETEETYKKLAGNRGLDILSTQDGSTAYIIGKFITFESASEYADLLVRNGCREAKVVAYLGPKEVPVETAKELFDKIK